MAVQIFNIITNVWSHCISWFVSVFNASQFTGLFLTVIFFLMLKRYLLDPLFSDAGSDTVSKRKKDS